MLDYSGEPKNNRRFLPLAPKNRTSMTSSPPALTGLHHVTAVTGNAPGNLAFYTKILGLRLVKKTVNQDDVSAYHLFYGDELGRPGTEVTFFDWPNSGPAVDGVGTISEIALRIPGGRENLEWWNRWFTESSVSHGEIEDHDNVLTLPFKDPEGQPLRLIAEQKADADRSELPWSGSPAPAGSAIAGLGAVTLSVRRREPTARILTEVLGFRSLSESLFETGPGGPGAQIYLKVLPNARFAGHAGIGGVHHVALRTADAETQKLWLQRIADSGLGTSGIVDRYYFKSVYFREAGGILFEIATDGPGFASDEEAAHLGERLALPPFLEARRAAIEAGLTPLNSK
jgi:glyoxalase family protein